MPRRSVRLPDPALDLSRWLLPLEQVPQPFDPRQVFGNDADLEIEIGSGKGLFLQNATASFPQRNFLGIELAKKYASAAAGRLAKQAAANGKVVSGDAVQFFAEWLRDGQARAVHVYFPDPWWKKRHRKRRVMRAELVRDIERVLAPGGVLHFWTDVEEYYQTTLELIAAVSGLRGPLDVGERPAEHDLDYRTHFERRMRLHSLPVYRSQFVKSASPRVA